MGAGNVVHAGASPELARLAKIIGADRADWPSVFAAVERLVHRPMTGGRIRVTFADETHALANEVTRDLVDEGAFLWALQEFGKKWVEARYGVDTLRRQR